MLWDPPYIKQYVYCVFVFAVHVLNTQLISVFNFIVTVGGSFAFAYKATEYSLETPNYALVR